MAAHIDFMNTLLAAAERGEDPALVLRAAEDHLVSCEECRRAFGRWMIQVFTEEELILMAMRHLDETGQLETPPPYPAIDYSFLDAVHDAAAATSSLAPALAFWREASEQHRPSTQSRLVHEWAGSPITVSIGRQGKVTFRDLHPSLLPSRSVLSEPLVASRRRGAKAAQQGEMLKLRDDDHNVVVAVTIQASGKGASDIGVGITSATPDAAPRPAVVTLRSLSGGADKAAAREGRVTFASNLPDTYTIEIEVTEGEAKGQTWRLPLTLERERHIGN
ncbi:MAG: hypothetical protein U0822_10090 [Anaerolineae bacterium]